MAVNAPSRAFFWDDTTKSWRKAVTGEAGEYVWDTSANAWVKGTIGAEYVWNDTTKSWDFGPGGEFVWNSSTRSWDKVTSPGYGGPFYWDESTKSWLKNTDAAQVSDAFARWDFINNQAWWNGAYVGGVSSTPNWTFTRASTGYAQTSGGVLQSFASGELRRTDKGVLIEGAGTNLCLQSQTFGTTWTTNRASVGSNSTTAPDGTTTADTLIEDNTSGQHFVQQTIVTTDTATYTLSAFFKAKERSVGVLVADAFRANFNLANGTVSDTAGTPTSTGMTALADGWYRCWMVFTADASTVINLGMNSALTSYSYAGDGTSGIYLWGAQLEATAYASSYVPTTTGSATRAADSLTVTGVSGLDYPLTLYAEFEFSEADSTVSPNGRSMIGVHQGSSAERAQLYNISSAVGGVVQDGGVTQAAPTIAGTVAAGAVTKLAMRVEANNFIAAKNGTLSALDSSGTLPAAPDTIGLGMQASASGQLYGYLRRAAIFSRALSDGELQALTAA